jgi:uncharacterized membrane protein
MELVAVVFAVIFSLWVTHQMSKRWDEEKHNSIQNLLMGLAAKFIPGIAALIVMLYYFWFRKLYM